MTVLLRFDSGHLLWVGAPLTLEWRSKLALTRSWCSSFGADKLGA
jgi:hypothetical protein